MIGGAQAPYGMTRGKMVRDQSSELLVCCMPTKPTAARISYSDLHTRLRHVSNQNTYCLPDQAMLK